MARRTSSEVDGGHWKVWRWLMMHQTHLIGKHMPKNIVNIHCINPGSDWCNQQVVFRSQAGKEKWVDREIIEWLAYGSQDITKGFKSLKIPNHRQATFLHSGKLKVHLKHSSMRLRCELCLKWDLKVMSCDTSNNMTYERFCECSNEETEDQLVLFPPKTILRVEDRVGNGVCEMENGEWRKW